MVMPWLTTHGGVGDDGGDDDDGGGGDDKPEALWSTSPVPGDVVDG